MRKIITLVLLLLLSKSIYGFQIDSIQNQLSKLSDKSKLEYISNLNFNLLVQNNQELIPIIHSLIEKAKNSNEQWYLSRLYGQLSLAYYYNGKYDLSYEYGLKAADLYEKLGKFNELGNIYGELGYQTKRRDLEKAFHLMRKGIIVLEKLNDPVPLAKIYDNYGVLHEMKMQLDSALFFYKKALSFKKSFNDSLGIPFSLNNLYMAYMLKEDYKSALSFLDESTLIRKSRNDGIGLAENYSYYGEYYYKLQKFNKALSFYKKALDLSLKHNYTFLSSKMYLEISNCYLELQNHKNSLIYFKKYKAYSDSLLNIETNQVIAKLEVQYETAEKEKKLIIQQEEIKYQSRLKWFFSLLALLVITALVLYYIYRLRINKRNEKIKVQEALIDGEQNERNRLAMELHDGIVNEMNSVLIQLNKENEENTKRKSYDLLSKAKENVRKFSHQLMPLSLTKLGLNEAISELAQDLQKENLSINIQISGNEDIPIHVKFNLFRIVQESLNNILKHANANEVLIDIHYSRQDLSLCIEDNGVGFDMNQNKRSKGIHHIYNRVKLLQGKVCIDSELGKGTSIEIIIPLHYGKN